MSDAIDRATEVIRAAIDRQADIVADGLHLDVQGVITPHWIAEALATNGLLAPAPLREEPRSEHTVRETAAYFARRVQRVGDRISDRDYRRSLVDVVALENVQGFLDRIARDDLGVYAADAVNRAEGDGRDEREPTVPASQLRAFARLCVYWGDMTPAAARMLDRIIDGDGRAEK